MVVGPRVQTKATSSKSPWRNPFMFYLTSSLAGLDVAWYGRVQVPNGVQHVGHSGKPTGSDHTTHEHGRL
jgi:hypothetical protein